MRCLLRAGEVRSPRRSESTPQYWAEQAPARLRPAFRSAETDGAVLRPLQSFHAGHQRLIEEDLRRAGQVCIAARDTHGIDSKKPLPFFAVKQRIETVSTIRHAVSSITRVGLFRPRSDGLLTCPADAAPMLCRIFRKCPSFRYEIKTFMIERAPGLTT